MFFWGGFEQVTRYILIEQLVKAVASLNEEVRSSDGASELTLFQKKVGGEFSAERTNTTDV